LKDRLKIITFNLKKIFCSDESEDDLASYALIDNIKKSLIITQIKLNSFI